MQEKRGVRREPEAAMMSCEGRGRGDEPRRAGSLRMLEDAKKQIPPQPPMPPKGSQPYQHLDFRVLASRNVRE